MSGPLPTVAVVYDIGSVNPMEIVSAAEEVCEPLVLIDAGISTSVAAAAVFAEFGVECDIADWDTGRLVNRLRDRDLAGLLTYSEFHLARTAELAAGLGLRGHRAEVVRRLTDKAAQRDCLAAAGVDAVRHRVAADLDGVPAALRAVGFPAVVKPLVGSASRDVFRVDDPQRWAEIRELLTTGENLLVEEYLVGDPECAGVQWGDYVSAELVSSGGEHACMAVVGKFPLAPPFREAGMLYPPTVPAGVLDEIRRLATAAVDAIGVVDGVTHTEIKLTVDGPRVIEVNGRVGGYVGDILRRAGGVDPARMALLAAMGERPVVTEPATDGQVTFQRFLTSPPARVRVADITGVRELRLVPGVERVLMTAQAGDVLDWQSGTQSYLGTVSGRAASHHDLIELARELDRKLRVEYQVSPAVARSAPITPEVAGR